MTGRVGSLVVALVVAACSDGGLTTSEAPGEGGADGPYFRFELGGDPAGPLPMAGLPYPNDVHLDGSGRIAVSVGTLPLAADASPTLVEAFVDALRAQDGFGVTTGAVFPFGHTGQGGDDAPVDVRTVSDATVSLIDLATGESIPVEAFVREGDRTLSLRPLNGIVLVQGRTYAYLLREGIATTGGEKLHAAPGLTALLGDEPAALPARAVRAYEPLRAYMAAHHIDVTELVGATVFTTARHDQVLDAAREVLLASPAPSVVVERVIRGADLDLFLGTPADENPGWGNVGGIAHGHVGGIVLGHFASLDFQSPEHGVLGTWELDDAGVPVPKGTEAIPFMLVLPAGAPDLADLPVVVFQHGLTGNRASAITIANTFAARGWATFGIDLPFHGDRDRGAVDRYTEATGAAVPDGVADTGSTNGAYSYFDVIGDYASGVRALDPAVTASCFRQGTVDIMAVSRLLREGDWSAVQQALPGLSFATKRLAYVGESFGAIHGGLVAAFEPTYGAVFISVGGGGLVSNVLENSPAFWPQLSGLSNDALGIAAADAEPGVTPPHTAIGYLLYQQLVEPGDPLTYAHRINRRPVGAARHLVALAALGDDLVPNQSNEALAAAMGLEWLDTSRSAPARWAEGMNPVSAPVSGNIDSPAGPVTGVYLEVAGATHGLLTTRSGTMYWAPGFPPFLPLDPPVSVDNPVIGLQSMVADFVASYFAGGPVRVNDPFATVQKN